MVDRAFAVLRHLTQPWATELVFEALEAVHEVKVDSSVSQRSTCVASSGDDKMNSGGDDMAPEKVDDGDASDSTCGPKPLLHRGGPEGWLRADGSDDLGWVLYRWLTFRLLLLRAVVPDFDGCLADACPLDLAAVCTHPPRFPGLRRDGKKNKKNKNSKTDNNTNDEGDERDENDVGSTIGLRTLQDTIAKATASSTARSALLTASGCGLLGRGAQLIL